MLSEACNWALKNRGICESLACASSSLPRSILDTAQPAVALLEHGPIYTALSVRSLDSVAFK